MLEYGGRSRRGGDLRWSVHRPEDAEQRGRSVDVVVPHPVELESWSNEIRFGHDGSGIGISLSERGPVVAADLEVPQVANAESDRPGAVVRDGRRDFDRRVIEGRTVDVHDLLDSKGVGRRRGPRQHISRGESRTAHGRHARGDAGSYIRIQRDHRKRRRWGESQLHVVRPRRV